MSIKTRRAFAKKSTTIKVSELELKGLSRIFVYVSSTDTNGPWIVVPHEKKDDVDAMIHDILSMAAVGKKVDKNFSLRGESFDRYELKKEWALQVVSAIEKQFKSRPDLERFFQ